MIYTLAAAATLGLTAHLPFNPLFEAWKTKHAKSYASLEEEKSAFKAFEENSLIIQQHNAKNLSYTLGHNAFSDLTWEQFKEKHMSELFLNRNPKNARRVHITQAGYKLADAKDWVADGAVTAVKDQARCGSCWAFSTTGSVEGAYAVASGNLVSLSEQQLVSCDHNGDMGCNGGLMDNAFKYIESAGGITTEADYPYTSGGGSSGTCDTSKVKPAVTITGYTDVPSRDETALLSAIAKGPVSVAIEADKSAFQLYAGGVLDSAACGTNLDHGVLAVGYGTDEGKDYYKVKNSWGATWGESGYLRMVQGKNMCGIAMQPSYPTGAKAVGPSPPSPSPPAPPAGSSHYGDPKNGCLSDEVEITIQGVSGDFCTPKCSLAKECPTDVPAGVTAPPQCALQDSATTDKYCALMCSTSTPIRNQKDADAQCGANASCKTVQVGIGLCTYDD
jgi:C1A family cysteine protease